MTDATSLALGIVATLVVLAVLFLVAVVVAWALRESRKRRAYERAGVSHHDLYFDEHIPNNIRNFDLVTQTRFESWSRDIGSRLSTLSKDLDALGKARQGLDGRIDRLEKRLGEME